MKLVLSLLIALVVSSSALGCETADLIESWNRSGGVMLQDEIGRPITQFNWPTPDGRFLIHYDIFGENAVYHPEEDENPADGVPDYVNNLGVYLAASYDSLVIGLNFDEPPSDGGEGGDSRYDVYLTNVIGLTSPENPSDQYPGRLAYTSYMQLGHDLSFPSRYGEDPYSYMRAVTAHEFFHAIEFAYRTYSSDATAWWYESCANWAEEHVFDDLNDIYYNLPFYQHNTRRSLYLWHGPFIYGAWLYPQFLEERMGPDIVRYSWEKFIGFDFAVLALEYALRDYASSFNDEYSLHALWNYFTGPNYAEGFYSEGADFLTTVYTARNHIDYPVDWVFNPVYMGNVASSYIVFWHHEGDKGALTIEYYNSSPDLQAVCLAKVDQGNSVTYAIYDIDTGIPSRFVFPDFMRTEKVVMIPVWLFEGSPRSHETYYQYRAYLDTTITAIAGEPRPVDDFALEGAYPNPFNGSVTISFSAPEPRQYRLKIYDVSGRLIEDGNGSSRAGRNVINWNAPNGLSSGVFFYVLDFQSSTLSGKMSLLK